MSNYGYGKKVKYDFPTAIKTTKESLKEQGFGVLTEIDVKATLHEKLGKDMEDYLILGACNPPLAAQAIDAEHQIGLLLPCNVIIYKEIGEVFVSAMLPSIAMSIIDNPKLAAIAQQAEEKLKLVIDNI